MTKSRRGTLSSQLARTLSRLAGENRFVFTVAEFARINGSSPQQAWTALNFLTEGGWTLRLTKGKYLIVPLEAGPESRWTEDAVVIACHLTTPSAVAYWSACHHWNWTEQVSRTVFVQTTVRPQPHRRTIVGVTYRLIHVTPRKFFGTVERSAGRGRFTITDREKTLVDALDRPDLCGGIRQVAEMLPAMEEVNWDKAETYLERMGSGAIYKRLGFLVEMLGEKTKIPRREGRLKAWRERLTGGYAPLEPGSRISGPVNNRWLVRVNVPSMVERERR